MTSRTIALIGSGGQLASDLAPRLAGKVVPLAHADIEITDPDQIEAALDRAGPDLVVNTAAYNLVDRAEEEPERAFQVNAFGPRNLARACGRRGIALLHVSTDYVFGGGAPGSTPITEDQATAPLGVYGASKLAGENFIRTECPNHFIVRTCGLYGVHATRAKGNFVETMLRLSETRSQVSVVSDQWCTPSYTADVAEAISRLVLTTDYGVYHATNSGETTWRDLAVALFELAGRQVEVQPIRTDEYGAKARRPLYSVLDSRKLTSATGYALPPWRDALSRYLDKRAADRGRRTGDEVTGPSTDAKLS